MTRDELIERLAGDLYTCRNGVPFAGASDHFRALYRADARCQIDGVVEFVAAWLAAHPAYQGHPGQTLIARWRAEMALPTDAT